MNRPELAALLRARRAKLRPVEAGLPEGPRRRTPGLRRQEVAQLAGMSVEYYIRLEQARGPRPSRQILNALGRALMLTMDERQHLFHLAGETVSPASRVDRDVEHAAVGVRLTLAPGVLVRRDPQRVRPLGGRRSARLGRPVPG